MNYIKRIEKSKSFWFLVFASLLFFILRLPSLFEPYWYADEGIYQAVGMLLRAGHPLYSGAWENKTPLLLALYALFNSDQYVIRGVSLIFGLISLWFFYYVAKHLFGSGKLAGVISLIYAVLFATPIMEGNIANAENFMLLPILIGAYLMITGEEEKRIEKKHLFFAGIFLSIAFLTKIVAFFDFIAFGTFLVLASGEKLSSVFKNKLLPYLIGFAIPFFITCGFFLITNNFKDFSDALLLQNVGYVGQNNFLIVSQGLLFLKLIILAAFLLIIYLKRKAFSKPFLFVTTWFAFSLFSVFFSGRPYDHYLLLLIPSLCLMIGLTVWEKRWGFVTFVILLFALFAVLTSFNLNNKIASYYQNTLDFYRGKISVTTYQEYFDQRVPRDYELANYIKMNTTKKDNVFIWGNNAAIYKLSDRLPITRYVVAYHITYFPTGLIEMEKAISDKKPKLIVITPDYSPFPLTLKNYQEKINIDGAIIYEKIY